MDLEEKFSIRPERYPTGIGVLDNTVLRGIPQGSTVAVVGPPESASELILHSLAATGRKTEYILTSRSKHGLLEDIKRVKLDVVSEEEIEDNVKVYDVKKSTGEFGDTVRKALNNAKDGGNLIIDSFSKYHKDTQEFLNFARKLHTKTKINEGVTYLYFASELENLSRIEKEVLQLVDGVFYVQTNYDNDAIENNLYINKLRGLKLPKDSQELIFGTKLTIDMTSDIG